MITSIKVNKALLEEAQLFCGLKTKKEVAEEALKLFILLNKQADIKALRGKLHWIGDLHKMREN